MRDRAQRAIAECRHLATMTEEPGRTTRRFLTPPIHDVHAHLRRRMVALSMDVRVDAAGNLRVVDRIVGQTRLSLEFVGQANHAGTTPMAMRRDALAGAAEWIAAVEMFASQTEGLAATVGRIAVEPNAANVIPGKARVSLDV